MPVYRVQAPDGSILRIEGPDNATEANLIAAAKAHVTQGAQPADPGVMGAMGIGFGRMSDRLLQGAKQGVLAAGSMLPGGIGDSAQAALDEQKKTQQFRDEGYAPLQAQHPIATMAGETGPLLPIPMGGSVRAAAGLATLPGLLEYGSPQDKLLRGGASAVGGAAGYGVGKVIGSVVSPGVTASNQEAGRLATAMTKEGVPLDVAQITGNQVLQNTKAALGKIPWTATGQQAKAAEQQGAFNAALLKRVGVSAKAATPDVMSDAHAGIVSKMDAAAQGASLKLDDAFLSDLAKAESDHLRRLPTEQKQTVTSYLDDILNASVNGGIPGDVYTKTRSELGRIAWGTESGPLREGAKGLQKALDAAFDRQATPEAAAAMKVARAQYAKYMTFTEALKRGRSQDGNLGAKQVYAQAQQDIPGFERGAGGDFNDLVRGGRQFMPDPIPNSGTPERALYMNLLTAGGMGGLGALGGALVPNDKGERNPIPGALLGLGGFGISKGAQGLLNSPMLTRYLMSNTLTAEQKKLLTRGGGLLGTSAGLSFTP